ncbi:uncharacterized protein LOC106666826 [Cimex lectularius]|uniref:CPR type cuticle protein n=1 Tax=Cimex lectularius TaxID=79782 RepID=A0A8I6RQM4_CIMLE|nr:uncharacterized protein LOC106666826 [Cimex lectularius]
MKASLALVAVLGLVATSYAQVLHGLVRLEDDGQWKPHLDGSVLGSGHLTWFGADLDDGQWKPHLDNSAAGLVHHLYKRAVLVNPNALASPADTLEVALAKQAQLVQQHTEGTRNVLGGGVPLHLPADTPEVALGKQAHAVAHENQKALTYGHTFGHAVAAPVVASHVAGPVVAARYATPYAATLGYSAVHPYGLGLHGVRAFW